MICVEFMQHTLSPFYAACIAGGGESCDKQTKRMIRVSIRAFLRDITPMLMIWAEFMQHTLSRFNAACIAGGGEKL
jgi:hypothetical protein